MKTLEILAAIGALLVLENSPSKAWGAPTDIFLNPGLPDLTGSYVDVTYDYNAGSGTGAFVASGWTTDYNTSSGRLDVAPDSYILSATISSGGVLASGGTFNIYGDVGSGDTLLLSGDLTPGSAGIAFGYGDGDNELFQFRFNVTGGTLAGDFGGNGAEGGIILNAWFASTSGDQPFTGSWAGSFNNNAGTPYNGSGEIDCFTVPEPGTFALVVCGLTGLLVMRRRSAMKSTR
jgi:hypothetical protein